PGSSPFSQDVLQHLLVEAQVGDELAEALVLLLQLLEPAQLGDAHPAEPLLPAIEGGLADAQLADDVRHGRAGLLLPQGERDLFFGIPGLLHGLGAPLTRPDRIKSRKLDGPGNGERVTYTMTLMLSHELSCAALLSIAGHAVLLRCRVPQ